MTSWIYFIQNTFTRNLKIGQSDEPPRRRNAFKTGNDCELEILGVIPGAKLLQRGDHEASVSFPPTHIAQVADILQAKKRKRLSEEHRAKLIEASAPYRFTPGSNAPI